MPLQGSLEAVRALGEGSVTEDGLAVPSHNQSHGAENESERDNIPRKLSSPKMR